MSNPTADWYPAITQKLEALGHEVVIPAMPGHRHPEAEKWIEIIEREVASNKEVVLVGHSLGTRAIVLFLNQSDANLKQVFLIAPPDIEEHPKRDNAWHTKVDFEKFKQSDITVLASKNDPIVKFEYSRNLARKLGAKFVETDSHGHFAKPSDAEIIFETIK